MANRILSPEQIAFRDSALVRNLRFKFPQLSNYSDKTIVVAYDNWFMSADSVSSDDEADFLEFIEESE